MTGVNQFRANEMQVARRMLYSEQV